MAGRVGRDHEFWYDERGDNERSANSVHERGRGGGGQGRRRGSGERWGDDRWRGGTRLRGGGRGGEQRNGGRGGERGQGGGNFRGGRGVERGQGRRRDRENGWRGEERGQVEAEREFRDGERDQGGRRGDFRRGRGNEMGQGGRGTENQEERGQGGAHRGQRGGGGRERREERDLGGIENGVRRDESGQGGGREIRRARKEDASSMRHNEEPGASTHGGARTAKWKPRNESTSSQYLGKEDIKKLSQGRSEGVLACIASNEMKFLAAYKSTKFCSNPVTLKQLVKILYLLVSCKDQGLATRIIAQIFNRSSDYAHFLVSIDGMIKDMQIETRRFIREENPLYLNYLVEIGLFAIQSIPRTVFATFPLAVIQKTIQVLGEQNHEKVDNLSAKVQELDKAFSLARSEICKPTDTLKKEGSGKDCSEEVDPPEPFTELSILPDIDEIHSGQVYLRSNLARGSYKSWEHYLDIQFRLLREDFVQPLRKGINQYCDTGFSRKYQDIYVYEKVNVLNPHCLVSGVGFQIRFDVSRFHRINWEHSRRLIFGSLLCLSSDDFNNRVLFASVAKREESLLEQGLLLIKFESDVNGFTIDPGESFVMVESTAYFEAYRHILEGLKDISNHPGIIPLTMKKYIIDCQLQEVDIPEFHRNRCPLFDLKDVLLTPKSFVVTDHCSWPVAEDTCLNESQLKAFEMALTKEICIIQGPPGTGKTYVGLKIVNGYLENRCIWDPQCTSPILVVCYTNHALDQFLEGIQNFRIDGLEPNIIRVGGRCKSAKLASCVLHQRVQDVRSKRQLPRWLHQDYIKARNTMFKLQISIDQMMEKCDTTSNKILSLSVLEKVIPPHLAAQLRYSEYTEAKKEIEIWHKLWYPEQATPDTESSKEGNTTADEAQPENQEQANEPNAGNGGSQEVAEPRDDAELIEVDNEARLLQDERLIEGEELELLQPPHTLYVPENTDPEKTKDQSGWSTVQISDSKRRYLIKKGLQNTQMSKIRASQVTDIWKLSSKRRWQLYLHWINEHIRYCKGQVNLMAAFYNSACDDFNTCKDEIECHTINTGRVDVIGMTTTGAAKHHHILMKIHPKIVIFEEAAEIFESHIVTSLSSSVQQVVLIGDHKQLQPKPNCYNLGKDYNFAVSMFERLANNGIEYITLNYQHRMRPEISRLISLTVYDNLIDHEQVKVYDHIKGVGKNLFFIDHAHPEELSNEKDMKTHVNKYEAEYLVELCHYLLKQGYSPKDITILTMYRGQLLELRKRMKRQHFGGVRVAAVDDYQGEENEIILLSLVRSNNEGKIGFLKIENRVCVSLSRAKKGLFIIGNMSMLQDKVESVWPKILRELKDQGSVGKALPLYCQIHTSDKISASKPEDFRERLEGGCTRICGTRLECGHGCTRLCHPTDREHRFFLCMKKCPKELPCGHPCKNKCHQCKPSCLPCREIVRKRRSVCGHTIKLPCSSDPATTPCPMPCPKMLPCNHQCSQLCSKKCYFKVSKLYPCGHSAEVSCFTDPNTTPCPVPCEAILACEHKCSGTCGACTCMLNVHRSVNDNKYVAIFVTIHIVLPVHHA